MSNTTQDLDKLIYELVKQRLRWKVEELIEVAKNQLDDSVDELCGHAIIDVLNEADLQDIKDRIVFEIRHTDKKYYDHN